MNGETVQAFEQAFGKYVGAKYAIALCNGTATLHTALVALGVKPGDRVAVPPLTMAATTIAVLHAGAVPVFVDVDPRTWLMDWPQDIGEDGWTYAMPVSLYGLHQQLAGPIVVDDAAQTLRPHHPAGAFTSYSFQASKILALGEGGMLCTNDEDLARKARSFSSLGYDMSPDTSKIDPATLKHPSYARHHSLGWNYRMSDLVAAGAMDRWHAWGTDWFASGCNGLIEDRQQAADYYRTAIDSCSWITPQHVPDGWISDYWCYAAALESADLWEPFTEAIVRHGGEMPFGAWRLTYQEPAFRHLVRGQGQTWAGVDYTHGEGTGDEHHTVREVCPVAEDLQPRLVQFQTNDVQSAQRNADAVAKAIRELDG